MRWNCTLVLPYPSSARKRTGNSETLVLSCLSLEQNCSRTQMSRSKCWVPPRCDELGEIKGVTAKIHMYGDASPKFFKSRSVALYSLREKVWKLICSAS